MSDTHSELSTQTPTQSGRERDSCCRERLIARIINTTAGLCPLHGWTPSVWMCSMDDVDTGREALFKEGILLVNNNRKYPRTTTVHGWTTTKTLSDQNGILGQYL